MSALEGHMSDLEDTVNPLSTNMKVAMHKTVTYQRRRALRIYASEQRTDCGPP